MIEGMRKRWLAGPGIALAVALAVALGWWALEARQDAERQVGPAEVVAVAQPGEDAAPERIVPSAAPSTATAADREIFGNKLAFARDAGLAGRPIGDVIARIGETFVGTPYEPGTLEAPGPEHLVINLRELDCVTFVENVLTLSRLVRAGSDDFDTYQEALTTIRYRDGVLDGYASRLHYFSDWIRDNEHKGIVRDITAEIGGVLMPERIDFMSSNPHLYEQLADPDQLAAIREIEAALNDQVRYYVPQDRIEEVAPLIRDGDIIAATSSIEGLDIAHTGIALWVGGRLHLLHAPLVGSSVEISKQPLAERIRSIPGQDGIMVARPF